MCFSSSKWPLSIQISWVLNRPLRARNNLRVVQGTVCSKHSCPRWRPTPHLSLHLETELYRRRDRRAQRTLSSETTSCATTALKTPIVHSLLIDLRRTWSEVAHLSSTCKCWIRAMRSENHQFRIMDTGVPTIRTRHLWPRLQPYRMFISPCRQRSSHCRAPYRVTRTLAPRRIFQMHL